MTHLATTLQRYLASADDVKPGDEDLARGLIEAETSQEKAISGDPLACQAFLRIDRVFAPEPVSLYGQDAPSLAHNRISIHFGKTDPGTGDRVPGDAILTALISEESLNNLLMNQNRGETGVCMTAETAMGYELGPYQRKTHDFRAIFETMLQEDADKHDTSIKDVIARIRSIKTPWSAKQAAEVSRSIGALCGEGDMSFALSRYLENLENQRVQTQVEASHTALHFNSVLRAMEAGKLLAAPERPAAPAASIRDAARSNGVLADLIDLRPRLEAYKSMRVNDTASMADHMETLVDRDMRAMLSKISDAVGDVSEILALRSIDGMQKNSGSDTPSPSSP